MKLLKFQEFKVITLGVTFITLGVTFITLGVTFITLCVTFITLGVRLSVTLNDKI